MPVVHGSRERRATDRRAAAAGGAVFLGPCPHPGTRQGGRDEAAEGQAGLDQKQRLQKALFPEGLTYSDGAFGTATTSLLFNMLQQADTGKTRLATPPGFEPGLSDRKSEVLGLWTMGSQLQPKV